MNQIKSKSRRDFLQGLLKISALGSLSMVSPQLLAHPNINKLRKKLTLNAPDANGIALLDGFSSRVVATEGYKPTANSAYIWHEFPDGGAVFADQNKGNKGGWIYVSNQESNFTQGGVGALKFNAKGDVIDAYRILDKTTRNCAGGVTPWNTWLSAEEYPQGLVWECDPQGKKPAKSLPICGTFNHEAAVIDPTHKVIYLTEDRADGCFYRVVLDDYPKLASGILQVAEVKGSFADKTAQLIWHDVPKPNPTARQTQTRHQVSQASQFNGGEGLWYFEGSVYFSTKGDDRIWKLDTTTQKLQIIYDRATSSNPVLSGVDNLTVDQNGYVYVAEDGGDMQVVVVSDNGLALPILQITQQDFSEVTGVAFTPDYTRMYLSSQRGPSKNGNLGITYEISGPFEQLGEIFKKQLA